MSLSGFKVRFDIAYMVGEMLPVCYRRNIVTLFYLALLVIFPIW
jgi:hypothetical protein